MGAETKDPISIKLSLTTIVVVATVGISGEDVEVMTALI